MQARSRARGLFSLFNRGTKSRPRWYMRFRDELGQKRVKRLPLTDRARLEEAATAIATDAYLVRIGAKKPAGQAAPQLCGPLLDRWLLSLRNRSSHDDALRARRHLVPRFGDVHLDELTPKLVRAWLTEMRKGTAPQASGKRRRGRGRRVGRTALGRGAQANNLALLSRFFSWCLAEELTDRPNPVAAIPRDERPRHVRKAKRDWLKDSALVLALMKALPEPFDLMLYIGHFSGLRPGELLGLRLSDVAALGDGVLTVRFNRAGPLKEDKAGEGKEKLAPAPDDSPAVLGPWIHRRRAQGAGPEDFLFATADGEAIDYEQLRYAWGKTRKLRATLQPGLERMRFYEATRHSFVSNGASRGVSLDELGDAVGHATEQMTRTYNHFRRPEFSPVLRVGLGQLYRRAEADA